MPWVHLQFRVYTIIIAISMTGVVNKSGCCKLFKLLHIAKHTKVEENFTLLVLAWEIILANLSP